MVYNPKAIAYIIPPYFQDSAISENVRRRKEVLEKLGYSVCLIEHQKKHFLEICLSLWKKRRFFKYIIIRLDGTSLLDKYSLLKLVLPKHEFIWEVHGFPQELLEFSENISTRLIVLKDSVKRKMLSFLISAYIFISPELHAYAKRNIFIRRAFIIPNFIHTYPKRPAKRQLLTSLLQKKAYIVLWGGDASLPWQATDLIPIIAQEIYQHDKNILFFLVGTHRYYPTRTANNVVYLQSMPHPQFISLVNQSDVCLALYHKPKHFPFYFYPMKLIDYLSAGKPVIATKLGSIATLIEHNINGFITNNDINVIAQIILRLKQNKKLAKRIAKNARTGAIKRLSEYQAKLMYMSLFQSLSKS